MQRSTSTWECQKLTQASVNDRWKLLKDKQLCFNCLYPHRIDKCTSKYVCTYCNEKHHSLLHRRIESPTQKVVKETTNFSGFVREGGNTLLATALIPVFFGNGQKTFVRALIDQGSTSNFVSEN